MFPGCNRRRFCNLCSGRMLECNRRAVLLFWRYLELRHVCGLVHGECEFCPFGLEFEYRGAPTNPECDIVAFQGSTRKGSGETPVGEEKSGVDGVFTCCISGGNWNNATNAGLFTVNVNNVLSNSNSNIGARIMGIKNSLRCQLPASWQKSVTLPAVLRVWSEHSH